MGVSPLTNITLGTADAGGFKIDARGLFTILEAALLNSDFDEQYYVSTNVDVRDCIKRGDIASGFEHFCRFGFFEGRRGWLVEVDQDFYLATYPDVRTAIAQGKIRNAQEHFDRSGEAERRLPYRTFSYFKPSKATRANR